MNMMMLRGGQKLTEPCAAESVREAFLSPEVRRALAGDHSLENGDRRMALLREREVPAGTLTLQSIFSDLRTATHAALSDADDANANKIFGLLSALDRIAPNYTQAMTDGLLNINVPDILKMIDVLAGQLKDLGSEDVAIRLLNVKLRVGQLLLGQDYDPIPNTPVADPYSQAGRDFLASLEATLEAWGFDRFRPHLVATPPVEGHADRHVGSHHHFTGHAIDAPYRHARPPHHHASTDGREEPLVASE